MQPAINVLTEFEKPQIEYASFWNRFWALLIDGLILLPLVILDIFNKTTFKSTTLIVITAIIALMYKPFCEFKFGATVGKKAIKLLVVTKDFQNLSLRAAVLRNIFDIAQRVFTLILAVAVFNLSAFQNIATLDEYFMLESTVVDTNWSVFPPLIIIMVDVLFLLSDKQRRSLHDRIGETLVVKSLPFSSATSPARDIA